MQKVYKRKAENNNGNYNNNYKYKYNKYNNGISKNNKFVRHYTKSTTYT